jgi:hypothetical protein
MNPLLQQMINFKINTMTTGELLNLASEYQLSITEREARQIVSILKKEKVDIANAEQRKTILREIAAVAGRDTAKKIDTLFQSFINQ